MGCWSSTPCLDAGSLVWGRHSMLGPCAKSYCALVLWRFAHQPEPIDRDAGPGRDGGFAWLATASESGSDLSPQPLIHVVVGSIGKCRPREQLESVRRAGVHVELRRHSSAVEPCGVRNILV
jgi:hypothetical protein